MARKPTARRNASLFTLDGQVVFYSLAPMIETLAACLLSLLLQGMASRTLALGLFASPYLQPALLLWLYRRGWLFGQWLPRTPDPSELTMGEWKEHIMHAELDGRLPSWFFKLTHCPVCLSTHIPAAAGMPVAALLLLALPAPWTWLHAVACWLLGWLTIPSALTDIHSPKKKTTA